MLREDMSKEQARAILATMVRNTLAAQGTVFFPWSSFGLTWRNDKLYKEGDNRVLIEHNALYGMSDEQIERTVLGLGE